MSEKMTIYCPWCGMPMSYNDALERYACTECNAMGPAWYGEEEARRVTARWNLKMDGAYTQRAEVMRRK